LETVKNVGVGKSQRVPLYRYKEITKMSAPKSPEFRTYGVFWTEMNRVCALPLVTIPETSQQKRKVRRERRNQKQKWCEFMTNCFLPRAFLVLPLIGHIESSEICVSSRDFLRDLLRIYKDRPNFVSAFVTGFGNITYQTKNTHMIPTQNPGYRASLSRTAKEG